MVAKYLGNGESIDLKPYYENVSRRTFMSLAGGVVGTSLTLPQLLQRTYGAKPEGKLVVNTRDTQGRPANVESVESERYRRLKAFEHFEPGRLSAHEVSGATIRQASDDPTDIVIQVGVKPKAAPKEWRRGDGKGNRKAVGRRIPGHAVSRESTLPGDPRDIPGMESAMARSERALSNAAAVRSTLEDVPMEYTLATNEGERHDLEGGSPVSDPDSSNDVDGTAAMVCYNGKCGSPVVLTAYHVADVDPEDNLEWNLHTLDVAAVDKAEPHIFGQDAMTFHLSGNVDYDVLGTDSIPDITGYWTYTGISNNTGGDLGKNIKPAYLYGATSGEVIDQKGIDRPYKEGKGLWIKYGAHTEHNNETEYGDSGGPWVDENGNLFGHHVGVNSGVFTSWNVLSVAGPTLDVLGASLSQDISECY